jgi:hypothetical protein
VHIVDEFPMTVTGKVRKVEMRELAVEILSRPGPGALAGGRCDAHRSGRPVMTWFAPALRARPSP